MKERSRLAGPCYTVTRMNWKIVALILYGLSLPLPGFTPVGTQANAPFGYQMVILGLFGVRSFKPVWVWYSWLANMGFFMCSFKTFTERGVTIRKVISMFSLVLGLSFLAVSEYQASGSTGDTVRYYWTEIRPATGYFVWLAALACMTAYTFTDKCSAPGGSRHPGDE